jgi:FlaA1/EpsC-like NDP-sugar epimerase
MSPDFRQKVLMPLIRGVDLAALSLSFFASFAISSGSLTWPDFAHVLAMRIKLVNLILFVGYLALCSAVFSACGLYRSHRLSHWRERLNEMVLATTLITGLFLVLKQIFYIGFAPHKFLPVYWLLTLSALFLSHEIVLRLLHLARLRGRNLRNIVIVGEGPAATTLAERVRQEVNLGYRVLRIIDVREIADNDGIGGVRRT